MPYNPESNNHISETVEIDFAEKVDRFRKRSNALYFSRLQEILPHLIYHKNLPSTLSAAHIERLLRYGTADICIGEDKFGNLILLGIALSTKPNYINYPLVQKIRFIEGLEEQLLPEDQYVQITPYNMKGNYVLIRNRFSKEFYPEISLIEHYAEWLSEIKTSRFSLAIQGKAVTVFQGTDPENSNRMNKLFTAVMSGVPGIKLDSNINVDTMIKTLTGAQMIPTLLTALKAEDNNVWNETLNMLGVQNLGVDKAAGVSALEAASNDGFVAAVANIAINARQDGFDLLNEKYKLNIEVGYNNDLNYKDKTSALIHTDNIGGVGSVDANNKANK